MPAQPCQKRVYIGTMDAKLHAVDADTGAPCADFGQDGVLDVNSYNTTNAKWPLSLLQPPTVFGDTLFLGWAGKDWAEAVDCPAGVRARRAHRRAALELRDPAAGLVSEDRHRQRLGLDVGRSRAAAALHPGLARRARTSTAGPSRSTCLSSPRSRRSTPTPVLWSGAGSSFTTTSGTSTPTPRRRFRYREGWPDHSGAGPDLQAGLSLRAQPRDRGAGLSDRGAAGAGVRPAGGNRFSYPALRRAARSGHPRHLARRLLARGHRELWYCIATAEKLRYEGRFTPPSLEGSLVYPGTIGGIEWGGGAVDPN